MILQIFCASKKLSNEIKFVQASKWYSTLQPQLFSPFGSYVNSKTLLVSTNLNNEFPLIANQLHTVFFFRFPFAIIFFQDISSITLLDGTTFVKRDNKIAGESSKLMIAAGPI